MARPDPIRNTYEDFPDQLKELLKEGKVLEEHDLPRVPRDTLLHDHAWHLKLLAEAALPPRNLVLPPPYPPSIVSTSEGKLMNISDLRVQARDQNEFVILYTITDPYVYSSTVTIVEDESRNAARLTVCNLEDSMLDPIIPKGSVLVVKQPCWSRLPERGYHVRVDHPSDLVVLDQSDKAVPKIWRKNGAVDTSKNAMTWKKEGDLMFLKKRFRKALERSV